VKKMGITEIALLFEFHVNIDINKGLSK